MKLTLLGTSDWRIDQPVASAGYIVQHKETTLKLDFGRGNIINLAQAGINWRTIDAIIITHIHPDHISDLMAYLQSYTLSHEDGSLTKEVVIYGPKGFKDYFEQFRRVIVTVWDHIPEVKELYDQTVTIGDLTITAAPMKHSISAIGIRIEADGKSMCYTGDTAYNDELVQLADHANLLLSECYFGGRDESGGHMGAEDVAQLANTANVKQVVLTHYPTNPIARQSRIEEVQKHTPVTVVGGNDLDVIEI